jgi:hypothetical protein
VVKSFELSSTVSIPSGRNVTLKAETDGLTISAAGNPASLFSVTGNLTIGNGTGNTPGNLTPKLIINGEGNTNDNSHIISVNAGGRFYMYNGVELRNAKFSGINLYGSNSTRANAGMVGGVIAGCSTGVRAWAYATFDMTDGIIYGTNEGANANTSRSIQVESDTTVTVLGSTLAVGQYTQTFANSVRIGSVYYSDLQTAINSANTTEIIVVRSFALGSAVTIPSGRNVTLKAETNGLTISRASGLSGTLFTVNGSLTLGNGAGASASHTPTLIINGGGSGTTISVQNQNGLTIQSGAELRNATYGVLISNESSSTPYSATMSGGAIAGCSIGVMVENSNSGSNPTTATFTMTGGIIYGTSAPVPAADRNTAFSIRVIGNSGASATGSVITTVNGSAMSGTTSSTQTFRTAP